ncbi:BREX system serine/threonine kinase PglW [Streptomyces sp. 8N114]|uniref:BREX system serine/threonine kinase PglW n=1 Tax=Streptomyces sp. 8N114 TaxID=3457419 RepID=UPI003FD689B1
MREGGRWTTITPSQYEHERKALQYIRDRLPDSEPYRAWSNFTFTADSGHTPEVDLLVAAPGGLYLIEIKSWHGRVAASGSDWLHNRRVESNPLHLANNKAQKLKSLLAKENQRQNTRIRIPFIQHAIFFSEPGLRIDLPPHQRNWLFGPEPQPGGQPGPLPSLLSDLLLKMPTDVRRAVDATTSRALPNLLSGIGIARSRKYFQLGSWDLESKPLDTGPDWEDYLADHRELPSEHRRVRIYLVERNAAQTERAAIERAARREMQVLHGISHQGIVQADTLERHENGPALVFRHPRHAKRLDHYMAEYGSQLGIDTRLDMIRQLAEALAYAHRRRLHHRVLSARSILVAPDERRKTDIKESPESGGAQGPTIAQWLRPQLQVSDWQTAIRTTDSLSPGPKGRPVATPASKLGRWADTAAELYLAPETTFAPGPDTVAMDIFGLGALTYLLLTGQPPATDRTELLARVGHEDGLRPGAVAESVTPLMDDLVRLATAAVPSQRFSSVAEFLEQLEMVEEDLTAPEVSPDEEQEEINLLEARPGDLVGGEWRIRKRLGTGSTSRVFYADNERTKAKEVLKVALSDDRAKRLVHEATVLGAFPSDSRVIRLKRPDTVRIGGCTALVLEHVGEYTVARKLRESGRLETGELETFSEYLFGAVDFLEGEGVFHRDIKPDNIAIKSRPNRTKQLVLFDFSLSGISVRETQAGTPRYLDPFIGTPDRPVYDTHAERYALAVTLHEMASRELPVWGDGATEPRYVDEPVTLASEAFDPALQAGLVDFFTKALARDAEDRFESLQDMHKAWRRVFDTADSNHPAGSRLTGLEADEDPEKAAKARDAAAAKATLKTSLAGAGLTERAVSAAHRLDAAVVEDLLPLGGRITALPGLGAHTRKELQARIKEWRARLGPGAVDRRAQRKAAAREVAEAEAAAQAEAEKEAAEEEARAHAAGSGATGEARPGGAPATGEKGPADPGSVTDAALTRIGLDSIAALLVPALQKNRGNENEVEAVRLTLRLPDAEGQLPDLPMWPTQQHVADQVGITAQRVGQILGKHRKHWAQMAVLRSVRAELVELLADAGRVASMAELADALLARRGCGEAADDLRRALAAAVVRAAVEADNEAEGHRFLLRRRGDRLLVALEISDDDGPDTPAAPALINYALRLGEVADRLAGQEILPTSASVLRQLGTVRAEAFGLLREFDHARLVKLAAAASANAAASPRLEIYPRDLSPVRALRLCQAGVAPVATPEGGTGARDNGQQVLRPEQIQERVRARFPDLAPLPAHPRLHRLLQEAGFELSWKGTGRRGGYVAPRGPGSTTGTVQSPSQGHADRPPSHWQAGSPEEAAAIRVQRLLAGARERDGFRALTVSVERYAEARDQLVERFGAQPADVSALFTGALRELVARNEQPSWETVMEADTAEPGTVDYHRLHHLFIDPAWELVRPRLEAALAALGTNAADVAGSAPAASGASAAVATDAGPLLLYGAGPLARYDRMQLPLQLAETSRTRGVWLLCPMDDPTVEPMVDQEYVPLETREQWIALPDSWITVPRQRTAGTAE